MASQKRPGIRPVNPNFSSGPCAKRPGWSLNELDNALIARSHRSDLGKLKLAETIDRTRAILGIPMIIALELFLLLIPVLLRWPCGHCWVIAVLIF